MRFPGLVLLLLAASTAAFAVDVEPRVDHHYVNNNGVKIHYATMGRGPLVVMIHGFPDYWYTWRDQMDALAPQYLVAAMDLRGYNLSDKPKGVENYDMQLLMSDVVAVIKDSGRRKAILMAHDWGGAIAWQVAMHMPELVDRMVILNSPHPRGLMKELAKDPEQRKNSQYARDFQKPGAESKLTAENLAAWVKDPVARAKYVEAFKRSDIDAMLNYYRRNYPREPYKEDTSPVMKVKAPVLLMHGLDDKYLLPGALNNTWDYVEKDLTIVTVPGAGHFLQQDADTLVNNIVKGWLAAH